MKILVAFHSETGNTGKLAQAIYEEIEEPEKDIISINEVENIEEYDLIFCGFPVQAGSVPAKVEPFLRRIPAGKKLAIFATHGSLRGGRLAITAFDYAMSLASKAKAIGTFGCRGKVRADLIEALMKRAEHKAWAEEARSAIGHPNEADIEDGREFAKMMVTKASSN